MEKYPIAIILFIISLDILAIYLVKKDDTYLLDNDKSKHIIWIVLIPIIGAIVSMIKIGYLKSILAFFKQKVNMAAGG